VTEEKKVRTSGGVPLTDELLDKLAEEAEAGYDPAKLKPRKKNTEKKK
jgi:CRISPR-associated endonuclease/helicase Cas3